MKSGCGNSRYQDVNCDHEVADAQNVAIDVVGGADDRGPLLCGLK